MPKLADHINGASMNAWLQNPSFTSNDYSDKVKLFVYAQMLEDFGFGCQRDVFKGVLLLKLQLAH